MAKLLAAAFGLMVVAAIAFVVLWQLGGVPGFGSDLHSRFTAAIEERLGPDISLTGLDFEVDTGTVWIDQLAGGGEPGSGELSWEIESIQVPLDRAALMRGSIASDDVQIARAWVHVTPQLSLLVSDIRGSISSESADQPVELDLSGALDGDGRLRCFGTVEPSGHVSLRSEIENAPVGPLGAVFPQWRRIAGLVNGTIDMNGLASAPDQLDADLVLDNVRLDAVKLQLDETLDVRAQLAELVGSRGPGTFEIDATDARMRYGESYEKVPGTSAHVTGSIVRLPGGAMDLADMHLRIGK